MPIDPGLTAILKLFENLPELTQTPLEQLRVYVPEFDQYMGIIREEVGSVVDKVASGRNSAEIPLRIYEPQTGKDSYATVVFYHGGGFVIGSIESYDGLCRMIANRSECRIVSVEYRLAPEHRFPAAVEDAFDAFLWVCDNIKSRSVAVMGDSAGGNLAAVVAQLARDEGKRLDYQVLIYPALLLTGLVPSAMENSASPVLPQKYARWFHDQYIQKEGDSVSPLASPLLTGDLSGLAPAMIVTGEFDPLRDHGEMYADRLRAAGVSVVGMRFSGMPHGFFQFQFSGSGKSAMASAAAVLRSALYG